MAIGICVECSAQIELEGDYVKEPTVAFICDDCEYKELAPRQTVAGTWRATPWRHVRPIPGFDDGDNLCDHIWCEQEVSWERTITFSDGLTCTQVACDEHTKGLPRSDDTL